MSGRIKVGLWLPFSAEQTVDGRSFTWRARVGLRPLTPLRVIDRYADAIGSTEGRLLGRVTLFHARDDNTARSAAARAAISRASCLRRPASCPAAAWPGEPRPRDVIVAGFDLPPERPEVRVRIDGHGAIRNVTTLRWGNAGEKTFQYIPFGGEIHAERRFGDLMLPKQRPLSAGGSKPRATGRSSMPTSAQSRQRPDPSHAHAPGRVHLPSRIDPAGRRGVEHRADAGLSQRIISRSAWALRHLSDRQPAHYRYVRQRAVASITSVRGELSAAHSDTAHTAASVLKHRLALTYTAARLCRDECPWLRGEPLERAYR